MYKRLKRIPLGFIVMALMLTVGCGAKAQDEVAAITFNSPEEAMAHFAEGVAAQDFDKVMEAFWAKEAAMGYDFSGAAVHTGAAWPGMELPSESTYFKQLNTAIYEGDAAEHLSALIVYIGYGINQGEDGELDVETVPQIADKLDTFQIKRLDVYNPSMTQTEEAISLFAASAAVNGGQSYVYYLVLYEMDETTLVGGVTFIEYEGTYKICALSNGLAYLNNGMAMPMSEEDYDQWLYDVENPPPVDESYEDGLFDMDSIDMDSIDMDALQEILNSMELPEDGEAIEIEAQ